MELLWLLAAIGILLGLYFVACFVWAAWMLILVGRGLYADINDIEE